MPIHTVRLKGHLVGDDGSLTEASPRDLLQARGVLFEVTVGMDRALAQIRIERGDPVPPPVAGMAMIDTGASSTCIDEGVAAALGLPVVDVTMIATPSHDATATNVHPAVIRIVGVDLTVDVDRAMGVILANQELVALIGRDVLTLCTLHYDGLTGTVTLAH